MTVQVGMRIKENNFKLSKFIRHILLYIEVNQAKFLQKMFLHNFRLENHPLRLEIKYLKQKCLASAVIWHHHGFHLYQLWVQNRNLRPLAQPRSNQIVSTLHSF